jgi:uridine kinase
MKSHLIIGIAGGSGSGKTTVAKKIFQAFDKDEIAFVDQDSYYKDLSYLPLDERRKVNFDHPNALDTELLLEHVRRLKEGQPIKKPIYSFKVSAREDSYQIVMPGKAVIVEGILIFDPPALRDLMDIKIFVDADDDIRLIRRITRDIKERGRSLNHILEQYSKTVRPMHLEFVLPTKRYADVIIPRGGNNQVAIDMVIAKIRHGLKDSDG